MFIVNLTYIKPLEEIDQVLKEHSAYLDTLYAQKLLLCSGRKNPRTGGLILVKTNRREVVDEMIAGDPFFRNKLARYEVIEFNPTKWSTEFGTALG